MKFVLYSFKKCLFKSKNQDLTPKLLNLNFTKTKDEIAFLLRCVNY